MDQNLRNKDMIIYKAMAANEMAFISVKDGVR